MNQDRDETDRGESAANDSVTKPPWLDLHERLCQLYPWFPADAKFAPEVRETLIRGYLAARPASEYGGDWTEQAEVFVRTAEITGAELPGRIQMAPERQKSRKRALDRLQNALTNLFDAIDGLDNVSRGWWYDLSKQRAGMPSVDSIRAQVEVEELWRAAKPMLLDARDAAAAAAESLPPTDQTDPRLRAVWYLMEESRRHLLPQVTTGTGYLAEVLRAVFDLAGIEKTDSVPYWLKKAAEWTPPEYRSAD